MAAVADFRNDPSHQTQMYSIFRQAAEGADGDASWPNRSFGMDGMIERGPIDERSQHETPLPQTMATAPKITSIVQRPGATYPTEPTYSQPEGLFFYDMNSDDDRRKRRKVSGEGWSEAKEYSYHNQEQEPLPAKLRRIPVQVSPEQPPALSHSLPTSENAPQTPTSSRRRSPRSSANKRTTEGDNGIADVTSQEQVKIPIEEASPSKSKRTPKKKMLRLSGSGKLINSPQKNPQIQEPPPEPKKTRRTNRNVQVKGGKIVQSLIVVLNYGGDEQKQNETGQKIHQILTASNVKTSKLQVEVKNPSKTTHPFFLGKNVPRSSSNLSIAASTGSIKPTDSDNESDANSDVKKPVPWKDIVFKSSKTGILKHPEAVPAMWPPLDFQHVGKASRQGIVSQQRNTSEPKLKQKKLDNAVSDDENFLNQFSINLKKPKPCDEVLPPERVLLDGQTALHYVDSGGPPIDQEAVAAMRKRTFTHVSAFDRAVAAGPLMWPQQLSPTNCEEVLQPASAQLLEWLKGLAVHNVKQGTENPPTKAYKKKRKPKRRDGELDDFIVDEDEDDMTSGIKKNAILITGPNGCGKTASVYAVAKQLGFEVFEIHPGMRRSAKDIFDKVGDMAQNHLVQRNESLSRSSSLPPADLAINSSQERTGTPATVANFFSTQKNQLQVPKSRPETPQPSRKEQKQSLILFEEVDILFDDDRGFWSGVQSLIQQSKRPVILTCNDASNVPFETLDLHSTLHYSTPPDHLAANYLAYLAASEGHLLDREALQRLYSSKRRDLRAAITELNFWCQMTVGSKKGGLDWLHSKSHHDESIDAHHLRTFSKGTFHSGLDLYPQVFSNDEQSLAYAHQSLNIAPTSWNLSEMYLTSDVFRPDKSFISQYYQFSSCESDMDILGEELSTGIAATLLQTFHLRNFELNRDFICEKVLSNGTQAVLRKQDEFEVLCPLMIEKPTFPPAQGRLAPSLDCYRSSIATDIAPYVRSIADFDVRADQQREAIFGPPSKRSRTTRAAKAAAEGGTIANTRPEKWFPQDLNLQMVLDTGRYWPKWAVDTQEAEKDITMSQADTELSMGEYAEKSKA